jgi:transcription antitermination factor NusG
MKWYVLYIRSRTEKKMAEYSVKLNLHYYLPLRTEVKIFQRRKVQVEKPVFPSYFFVRFDDKGRIELLKSNHIVYIIDIPHQRKFLHELAQIRKALRVDSSLGSCTAYEKGRMVKIKTGPFSGIEGCIDIVRPSGKVLLNVDMIGQAVVVELDKDYIDLLD